MTCTSLLLSSSAQVETSPSKRLRKPSAKALGNILPESPTTRGRRNHVATEVSPQQKRPRPTSRPTVDSPIPLQENPLILPLQPLARGTTTTPYTGADPSATQTIQILSERLSSVTDLYDALRRQYLQKDQEFHRQEARIDALQRELLEEVLASRERELDLQEEIERKDQVIEETKREMAEENASHKREVEGYKTQCEALEDAKDAIESQVNSRHKDDLAELCQLRDMLHRTHHNRLDTSNGGSKI
ncbi:hypothetical protein ONZ45_g16839 [Pleurotus djamor]|nr:hypothetical protein ONZ45_g16839 [Pleurotus djamor]